MLTVDVLVETAFRTKSILKGLPRSRDFTKYGSDIGCCQFAILSIYLYIYIIMANKIKVPESTYSGDIFEAMSISRISLTSPTGDGWWLSPTPLKNAEVSNSWDDDILRTEWKFIKFMFQSSNQKYMLLHVTSCYFISQINTVPPI
jgi:hypothetical protein